MFFLGYLVDRGPYLLFVLLVVIGVFLMMSQRNMLKAVVGLYLFQTAVILQFITISFRRDGSVPIVEGGLELHNPLPHAMMLTAIVVGVATLGVAIALLRRIQAESGTIEERAMGPDEAAADAVGTAR
ncbi:MAG TPA: cation:proton antiporter subunit C [Longimicrobiales bacterium]|nr:cation:proton antiporter subunit C [Longimicrobiales bacterium]